MSLRELTKDNHANAERQEFVKILFSGSIEPKLYATYLINQHAQYNLLEVCAMKAGLFNDMAGIRRAPAIYEDYLELWPDGNEELPACPVVKEYMNYILTIQNEPERLMAHVYVRHMGDLAGGQMIAKRVPGQGRYYQFTDSDSLKNTVRSKINDSMAEEAKICFDFATQFFQEMLEVHHAK